VGGGLARAGSSAIASQRPIRCEPIADLLIRFPNSLFRFDSTFKDAINRPSIPALAAIQPPRLARRLMIERSRLRIVDHPKRAETGHRVS